MNTYVLDTHPLYWHLIKSPRLGERAREIFAAAGRGEAILIVPAIVVVELLGIYDKYKPSRDLISDIAMLRKSDQFRFVPFGPDDFEPLFALGPILELHDRMIVACAKTMNVPCITKDARIVESKLIETVW